MIPPRVPGLRRVVRAALLALSAISLVTCAEDPVGPATGEARLRIVPVFASSMAPPLTIDAVHVRVRRPDVVQETSITVFDDTVSFSPDANSITLRDVRIRMSEQSEDLEVDLELLAGTTVMFAGGQTVTVIRGRATQPTSIALSYTGPGANVATLTLAPRDTSIVPGAVVNFRLDAFDSAGAPVPQYYASWSLTGGSATGARINAVGRLTAPAVADTFFVKAVNVPTGSTDSTRVIVAPVAPPPPITVIPMPITAGNAHTCEIRGTVTYCWGENSAGQLGDGTTTQRLVPTPVLGGQVFVAVSAGLSHSCGLTAQGQAFCWGDNSTGALGDGTTTSHAVPTAVSGGLSFAQIAAANQSTCAITLQGEGRCWGSNFDGQLGNGTTTDSPAPVPVSGGHVFIRISASGEFDITSDHACAIDTNQAAWCWGANLDGELGDGSVNRSLTPVAVTGGLKFAEIALGGLGSCGVTTAGELYCWGRAAGLQAAAPQLVPGGFTYTAVTLGDNHACARSAAGWRCVGANGSGQLGDGSGQDQTTPVLPSGGRTYSTVAAGTGHTCGITATGSYCWGNNNGGQLGLGDIEFTSWPTPVPVAGAPATVTIGQGNGQSAPAGTAVALRSEVLVKDRAGAPLPGVEVIWTITAGGGTVDNNPTLSTLTDNNGFAVSGVWVLGPAAGANTMTARVSAAGVTGNPVSFTATGTAGGPTTVTWTGAVSNSWYTAGNWTPRLPAAGDNVVIPGIAPAPALTTTPVTLNNLTIQTGGSLDLGQTVLGVNGSLAADGPINGFGNGAGVVLVGNGGTLHGTIDANAVISGAYLLDGNLIYGFNSTGLFAISVTGSLGLNGHAARVRGSFATAGTGTLSMTNALDSLVVSTGTLNGGTVLFSGGSTAGKLTNGRLLVSSALAQSGDPAAFAPSGSHRTVFTGGATVTLLDTVNSGFQDLDVNGQRVSPQTALPIKGTLIASGNSILEMLSNNSITAAGVNVSGLTVENGPLTIGNGTITRFDSVTFTGQAATVTQLSVRNNGAATPFTFTGLKFLVTPAGPNGFYLDANDLNGATGGVLTLNLAGASPAAPGGFTRVSNGAVINWPTVGAITWTGAINTDWNTTGNWNPNRLPTSGDSVVIPNAVTNFPTLTGRAVVGAMFEDGRLTINGGVLQVSRSTSSNNGINRIIQLSVATDSLIVGGTLGTPTSSLGNGGVVVVGGDVTGGISFTGMRFVANGSGAQSFSAAGPIGLVTIDKPAGVLTFGNGSFQGDSMALLRGGIAGTPQITLTGGFFSAAGTTVALGGALTVGTTINALGSYSVVNTGFNLQPLPAVLTLPQLPYTNLTISGTSALAGSQVNLAARQVVNGNFTFSGNGGSPVSTFVLGGRTLVVNGTLTTNGLGQPRLLMTNPLDSVLVSGDASFGGSIGGNPGNLTAGTLVVGGNFIMGTQFGGANFQATGTHTTVLTSNNPTVTFFLPGTNSGSSRFQNLTWTGTGTMTLGDTATIVSGTLTTTATGPVTFLSNLANGSRLQFRAMAAAGPVTFSKVPVGAVQTGAGGAIGLGNATFTGMPTTLPQLTIQHPGIAGGLTLPGLTFNTTPTGAGVYVSATDNNTSDGTPLVVTLTTPTPATSGGFITQVNSTINWGVGPIIWTGNVSTAWNVGGNWNTGLVPSSSDSVTIPGVTNQPSLTAAASVGAVVISGSTLALNSQTLSVARTFATTGTGRVSSTTPASLLVVAGNALFNGGDETGLLTDGNFRLAGNFSQGTTANSFVATGNHTTFFNGTGAQTITLLNGGAAASRFQKVRVSNATGTVTVSGTTPEMVVTDTLGVSTGATLTGATGLSSAHVITSAGSTLNVFLLTVPASGLSVAGTYGVNLTVLTGGGTVPPVTYTNLRLTGATPYSLGANAATTGFLDLQSDLAVGGHTLAVAGDLLTTGTGTLTMTNAADLVTVAGATSFSGGDESNKLTAGILRTSNQFLQDATTSPAAFVASGNHTVEIISQNPSGGVVSLANPTVSHFQNLRVLFISQFVSDVVVNGNMEVNFNAAANSLGKRVTVGGTFTKSSIGFFGPTRLTLLGGSTVSGGTIGPDTLEFAGVSPQTYPNPNFTFPNFVLVANDVTAGTGAATIANDLEIRGSGIFRLGTTGNTFNVGGNLRTVGNGRLQMIDAGATLAVSGNASFAGGSTDGLLTAGTLSIGGNFTQSAVVSTTSYAPGGTHKTVFSNTVGKTVSMGSPGLLSGGSHFQVLDVSAATGGISLDVNMQADSIISTNTAAKISSPGVTLTVRRAQVTGLSFNNTTLNLDEQGVANPESLTNVSFAGFPTSGVSMLQVVGPGNNFAARPLVNLSNMNFQTLPAGASSFYVDLTSDNNAAFNLNLTTSNQATNAGGNGAQHFKVTPGTGIATVTW